MKNFTFYQPFHIDIRRGHQCLRLDIYNRIVMCNDEYHFEIELVVLGLGLWYWRSK